MEYVKHKFYDGMKNRAQTFGDGAYKLTRAEAAKLLELDRSTPDFVLPLAKPGRPFLSFLRLGL
jgi:hypothetical protein